MQELNRSFLHPLGLALEVVIDRDGTERLGGVWDERADPEGVRYDEVDAGKTQRVQDEQQNRWAARQAALGYWRQPVVTVDEMAGAFDGPDSVEWLREHRR